MSVPREASVVVDLERRADEARGDVGRRHVLDVAQARCERQAGSVAFGLRFDVEIHRALQAATHAGDLLGAAGRGSEPRARNHNPRESHVFHENLSPILKLLPRQF
jgi:hypothetical protein